MTSRPLLRHVLPHCQTTCLQATITASTSGGEGPASLPISFKTLAVPLPQLAQPTLSETVQGVKVSLPLYNHVDEWMLTSVHTGDLDGPELC
jgi:hypothetical protein